MNSDVLESIVKSLTNQATNKIFPFKQLTVKIKNKNRRFDRASAVHKVILLQLFSHLLEIDRSTFETTFSRLISTVNCFKKLFANGGGKLKNERGKHDVNTQPKGEG